MSDDAGRRWGLRRVALAVGLVLVVLVAVVAGGLWLYSGYLYRTSYGSQYSYDVVLNTNETLENVSIYLPLPVADGKPDLGAAMVAEGADEANFSLAVVDTEYGPMLRVSTDRLVVTPRYYEFVEDANGTGRRVEIDESEYDPADPNMMRDANAGTLLTVYVPANESLATDDPWGVEPMLSPRADPRPADCGFPHGDWLACYEYDTRVYATYETGSTARVDLGTRVEGWNEWWVFGWNYDTYRDAVDVTLYGPQDGWTPATGTVEVDTDKRTPPGN